MSNGNAVPHALAERRSKMAWHKRSEGRREVQIGGGFWGGVENATHNHAVGAPRGTFDLLISLLCMYILSLVPKGTGEAEWLAFLNCITASVAQELRWKVNALTPVQHQTCRIDYVSPRQEYRFPFFIINP